MFGKRSLRLTTALLVGGFLLFGCPLAPKPPEVAPPTPTPVPPAPTPVPLAPTPAPPEATPAPPEPTPTTAAAVPGVPPELMAMGEAMAKVKTYRTKMVMEGVEILTEYVLPDKTHTQSEVMGMKVETIVIGDTTYTKVGDGPWQKEEAVAAPPPGAPEMEMPDITEMAEEIMAAIEVKEVGMETVEGVECRVYEIRFGEGAEPIRYYIGVTDNLPRKMEMGEMEIIYYDYNAPIEINPPI